MERTYIYIYSSVTAILIKCLRHNYSGKFDTVQVGDSLKGDLWSMVCSVMKSAS